MLKNMFKEPQQVNDRHDNPCEPCQPPQPVIQAAMGGFIFRNFVVEIPRRGKQTVRTET